MRTDRWPKRCFNIGINQPSLPIQRLTDPLDGEWEGTPPEKVTSVRIDSRKVSNGSLFVGLPGENTHGQEFLNDADQRGATAAIVEEKQSQYLPQFVVDSSTTVLRDLAIRYREVGMDCYRIGITGSCGKTTTKNMLATMLDREYRTGCTQGNFNNHLGLPLTMLNEGHGDVLVAEVATNTPGEIAMLSRWLSPHMGLITHIGADHLEGFGSIESVAREKSDIFESLERDGLALIPEGIEYKQILRESSPIKPTNVKNGMSTPFEVEWNPKNDDTELRFEDTLIRLPFTGEGLVKDAALAATAAAILGVDVEQIKDSLENFKLLKGRGRIIEIDGCRIIDGTYNANPDSMESALERLETLPGPRMIILGDMKELGETAPEAHRSLGRSLSRFDEARVIFVGEYSDAFREGIEDERLDLTTIDSVEDLSDLNFRPYQSALLKASNAVGLNKLIERTRDAA